MEKIKTLEEIQEELAKEWEYDNHFDFIQKVSGKNRINMGSELVGFYTESGMRYASQYKKRVDELESVVSDLAQWSRKYPIGRIYGISQMKMDDELISIEEKAKSLIPHEQQLTLTEKP